MCERLRLSAMDALAGLLEAPRATGAFLLRTLLRPPWSIRILDEAPLSVVLLVRGEAWIMSDSGANGPARAGRRGDRSWT